MAASPGSGQASGGSRSAPSPALQWVLPRAEVESWLKRAQAGERLIYAHGPQLIRGETSLYVRDLALAGTVDPIQPRSPDGGFDFAIQKRNSPSPQPSPAKGEGELDEAAEVIYRVLARDAAFGRRAHSNRALAQIAGLATPEQAAWRLAKLARAKRIRTITITTGTNAGWRIFEIIDLSTGSGGKQTAAPPSWEKARADARRERVDDGIRGMSADRSSQ